VLANTSGEFGIGLILHVFKSKYNAIDIILEVNKIIVIGVKLRMLMVTGKEEMPSPNFFFLLSVCIYTCVYYTHVYTHMGRFHLVSFIFGTKTYMVR